MTASQQDLVASPNARQCTIPHGAVVLIGCGNIGSQVVSFLPAMTAIRYVIVIDPGIFGPGDIGHQLISAADVGRFKADVMAERLRQRNPDLQVIAICRSVEEVPLGWLRAALLIACVDNRRARQWLNEASMRLGIALLDAAIDGKEGLARVNGFSGDPDDACLECSWGPDHYAGREQRLPCQPAQAASTSTTLQLGATAAVSQAHEVDKLMSGRAEHALLGRQLLVDPLHHQYFVSRFDINPACRLVHERWTIDVIDADPSSMTLEALFAVDRCDDVTGEVSLNGQAIARRLACSVCRWQSDRVLRLLDRLSPASRTCPDCHKPLIGASGEVDYTLALESLNGEERRQMLDAIGFERGDIVTFGRATGQRHVQLGDCQ